MVETGGPLSAPPNGQPEITCVFGFRGAGKTTWIRERIKGMENVLIHDVLGNYGDAVIVSDWPALREYFERVRPSRFKVSYRTGMFREDFPLVCLLVKALGKAYGRVTFVVDEVDLFSGPSWDVPEFRELIAQGRNYGVALVCASRTPAEVSKLLTSQAARFVMFTMHERRHIEYLASHVGESALTLPQRPFFSPLIHEFSRS